MIAVIASALRARPNPDLARMMRREAEAPRDCRAPPKMHLRQVKHPLTLQLELIQKLAPTLR
jgi:hypothetical protein